VTRLRIPESLEGLTPQWLTVALTESEAALADGRVVAACSTTTSTDCSTSCAPAERAGLERFWSGRPYGRDLRKRERREEKIIVLAPDPSSPRSCSWSFP